MADPQEARDPGIKIPLRRRSIYLLPNLVTTAALFAGFYAIVQAMNALVMDDGVFETVREAKNSP